MKKLTIFILIAILFTFSACGASTASIIEENFLSEGYEIVENSANVLEDYAPEFLVEDITVHVYSNNRNFSVAIILEYSSKDRLRDAFFENPALQEYIDGAEGEDKDSFYDSAVESGFVRDNCILVPISMQVDQIKEIFNR
ncbi:MAG: hypothetical protein IJF76_05365 [Clostridia bacterium]|nr:hypothetical protein [Clostridia bacterium]